MKAAVCHRFGEPLQVEEVELDPPRGGEVKVRVAACAICHSDLHTVRGGWGGTVPVIAGHEASGTVDAVGDGVSRIAPGDRVVVSLIRSCGHCYFCSLGRPFNCEGEFATDTQGRLRTSDGRPIRQGLATAAFAEATVVHQSQVVQVPHDFDLEVASLLACGVITGVGAVTNTVQVQPGSTVVVVGTGGVGINAIQGAVIAGAANIVAVDVLAAKLDAARGFGATHAIDATQGGVVDLVNQLTAGRGADYAFDTVGRPEVSAQILGMVRKGGTAVMVGMPGNDEAMASIDTHLVTAGRQIVGSKMGSSRLPVDIPRLIDLYLNGRLKLDELITRRYALHEVNEALASTERGEALRNVIVLEAGDC